MRLVGVEGSANEALFADVEELKIGCWLQVAW